MRAWNWNATYLKKTIFALIIEPYFQIIIVTVQRNVPRFCTRSICGWNLFQPLGLYTRCVYGGGWYSNLTGHLVNDYGRTFLTGFDPWHDRDIADSTMHLLVRFCPVNIKQLYKICTMLDQRRRRWAGVVQMLYKCFVFAGLQINCEENMYSFQMNNTCLINMTTFATVESILYYPQDWKIACQLERVVRRRTRKQPSVIARPLF